ncbi:type VII secretion system-associated protein [Kitasatospora sp. NPDC018058]|uniref:type VII secretion system-associated protein n=1 Tax=Kitasatospora sp. NPDC018058 TaxID=3364025 RepID=UPI0037BF1522
MTTPQPAGPPAPPITDALRQRALSAPGKWIYEIDPAFDPNGQVPLYGILGWWEVGPFGDLDWTGNPDYRPSPKALGMYQPENDAEAALQAAATGHGPEDDLLAALRDTALAVLAHPQSSGLYVEPHPETAGVVTAYTSPSRLPTDWPGYRLLTGRQIAAEVPGGLLRLNPTARPSVTVPLDDIAAS